MCQNVDPIDRTRPALAYKKLVNDSHSAFVVAVRWYQTEQCLEPWREMLFLDIRNAIADWGHSLRKGECKIELIDVCRCLDVYNQAVHNHRNFTQRVLREKAMANAANEECKEKESAAKVLLSVSGMT